MATGPLTFGPGIIIGPNIQAGADVIILNDEYLITQSGALMATESGDLLIIVNIDEITTQSGESLTTETGEVLVTET